MFNGEHHTSSNSLNDLSSWATAPTPPPSLSSTELARAHQQHQQQQQHFHGFPPISSLSDTVMHDDDDDEDVNADALGLSSFSNLHSDPMAANTTSEGATTTAAQPAATSARGRRKNPSDRPLSVRRVAKHPRQATVTTADGSHLTLYQSQPFESRERGKLAIRAFANAQGKRVIVDRTVSGGSNVVFICKSRTPCPFRVRILKSKKPGATVFYLTTLETEHGPECTEKLVLSKKRVMKDLRAASAHNTTLTLTGADALRIVDSIRTTKPAGENTGSAGENTGTTRPQTQTSVIVQTSVGDVPRSDVAKLEALLTHFQRDHPSASVHVDTMTTDASESVDLSPQLQCAFLKLPYASLIQQVSARLLGLEIVTAPPGACSNSNRSGKLLTLVAKDGNDDVYTLAVALCLTTDAVDSSEGVDARNLNWFLSCCLSSGIALDVPIVCDRTPAVLTAVATLPVSCLLIQSTRDFVASVMRAVPLAPAVAVEVEALVFQAQQADTRNEFDAALVALRTKSTAAATFVEQLDPTMWAKYCYLRKYALYGAHSSSLVTTPALANPPSSLLDVASPLQLFQHYIEQCMLAIYTRKRNAAIWSRARQQLTTYGEKLARDQTLRALACRVTPNDDDTGSAYVWDTRSPVPKRRRVCVSANACSCPFTDQFALPCKHIVAAAKYFNSTCGGQWDIAALSHAMYSAQAYADVYLNQTRAVSMPLEEELVGSTTSSVHVVPVGFANRCSVCHAFGHNKRRCPDANGGA